MLRFAVGVTAVVAALASCSGDTGPPSSPPAERPAADEPVVGLTWAPPIGWGMQGGVLRRYDPRSLEPVSAARLPLGKHGFSWAYSPDGTTIALGGFGGRIKLVDAERLRPLATTRLWRPRGLLVALTWVGEREILALVENFSTQLLRAVLVNPVTGDVTGDRRFELDGSVRSVEVIHGEALVALVAPVRVGPARVIVARADGHASEIVLDELSAGSSPPGPGASLGRQNLPGFAVDPKTERAFVLSGEGPLAQVDLRSGRVEYHTPARPISLLERLRRWLAPEAQAKVPAGPVREAAWVGDGILAVSGSTWLVREWRSRGLPFVDWDEKPAGLHLVDTMGWTIRTVDERATRLAASDGIVLAFGGDDDARHGMGVVAYTGQGEGLWHRFAGKTIFSASAHGGRAYVEVPGDRRRRTLVVLDLETGRIVARRPSRGSLVVFVVPDAANRYG